MSKISFVVLFKPSAWPRGVGPDFLSTSNTLMPLLRNQFARAKLKSLVGHRSPHEKLPKKLTLLVQHQSREYPQFSSNSLSFGPALRCSSPSLI